MVGGVVGVLHPLVQRDVTEAASLVERVAGEDATDVCVALSGFEGLDESRDVAALV